MALYVNAKANEKLPLKGRSAMNRHQTFFQLLQKKGEKSIQFKKDNIDEIRKDK